MNTTATASALPSGMQQRLQSLKDDGAPKGDDVTDDTPTNDTPSVTPTDDTSNSTAPFDKERTGGDERVTLSREEYNELKANSGRVDTLQGREQIAKLELEELQHRLTELENSNKGGTNESSEAPTSSNPAFDSGPTEFTDDEEAQYGETREYIEKVVNVRVSEVLNKLVPELRSAIDEAKQTAAGAAGEVAKNNKRSFHERLTSKVTDLQTYIKHPQWAAFLDEQDPVSGFTYEQLIQHHVSQQNLDRTAKIYELFASKYVKPLPTNAGYAGASPGGGAVDSSEDDGSTQKMKLSDRENASKDYRKGRITYEQLQEVNKKFQAADKAENVDYNS